MLVFRTSRIKVCKVMWVLWTMRVRTRRVTPTLRCTSSGAGFGFLLVKPRPLYLAHWSAASKRYPERIEIRVKLHSPSRNSKPWSSHYLELTGIRTGRITSSSFGTAREVALMCSPQDCPHVRRLKSLWGGTCDVDFALRRLRRERARPGKLV